MLIPLSAQNNMSDFSFFSVFATATLLPFLVPILVVGYMYYSTFFLEGIFKEYILKTEENKDEWFWN